VPVVTRDRPYTNKASHSCIIAGCLWIIIGLILIVIGYISETEKPTFFSIGIISFGIGFFLTILVCFYTELNKCYHNWAYSSHITPSHIEHSQLATAGDISMSYTGSIAATQKVTIIKSLPPQKPVKRLSNVRMNEVIITPSIEIGKNTTNRHDVL
jgi:hypothetical protein